MDRLEKSIAICIDFDGQTQKINISKLPKNVKEGDILKCLDNGYFEIDIKETKKRKQEIYNLQNLLFNNGGGEGS